MPREIETSFAAQTFEKRGPIRVTLPLSVAYDLDKFQAALRNIAHQTGHTGCTSGVDITFLTAREYVVNPANLEVTVAGIEAEL